MHSLKKAEFWKKLKEDIIQCELCPHFCTLKNEEIGRCKVRKNLRGELFSLVYGKPVSMHLDAIEKKPLYHFLPGEKAFSLATRGCNFACENCQNWEISQATEGIYKVDYCSPEDVIKRAGKAKIIAYTYTEPTIFYEYMEDIAELAWKKGIRNITVTNGFINKEPLKQLCKIIDASNIDLKSINNKFYEKVCKGRLSPVLEAIKIMHEAKVWIELTNLIIPGLNDKEEYIKKLASWVVDNLGRDVPLHFSAFFPQYKMDNINSTEIETLKKAKKIAEEQGVKFVYLGNIGEENNTYCPVCKSLLIKRRYFEVLENNIKKGRCKCGEKIPGVWE